MKAISAAIIVLAGAVFLSAKIHDTELFAAGLMLVGFVYWLLEMGRPEQ